MAQFLQKFDFSKCSSVNSISSFNFGANLNLVYSINLTFITKQTICANHMTFK